MHRPWDQSREIGKLSYEAAAHLYDKWLDDLKKRPRRRDVAGRGQPVARSSVPEELPIGRARGWVLPNA